MENVKKVIVRKSKEHSQLLTRQSNQHFIFGNANKLPDNILPTNKDVGRYFVYLKSTESENASNKILSGQIAGELIDIWNRASIPTIKLLAVQHKVTRLIERGLYLSRSKTSKKLTSAFKTNLNKLFDICCCKCPTKSHVDLNCIAGCKEVHVDCKCRRNSKVPREETCFLFDQRTVRKMYIGSVDAAATRKQVTKLKRKCEEYRSEEKRKFQRYREQCSSTADIANSSSPSSSSSSSNTEIVKSDMSDPEMKQQMRMSLPHLAMQADRYGLSDRSVAAIATATLIDVGMISKGNDQMLIDRSKVRRERKKVRKNLQRCQNNQFSAVYFDSRKDETLAKVKVNNRWYSEKRSEEHYVFLAQPGDKYICHKAPSSGKAVDVSAMIVNILRERQVMDNVLAIGCDSTNLNTGSTGGVARRLETILGRPLQRFICMLHTNELPLRHLFQDLDGCTSGATTFTGPIGKAITTCENKAVVKFTAFTKGKPLPSLEQNVIDDLSEDQQYLYRIISAIRTGDVDKNLARLKPGPLSHSRWLTLASRVCRLYVSSANCDRNLRLITKFIVMFYGPLWFEIKSKPNCCDGPKHLFSAINCLKNLPIDIVNIVKPYVSRNAYFAHSENVLLAMLADSSRDKRETAVRRILQARRQSADNKTVRIFRVPNLNFDATDWDDIINWSDAEIHEPPLTRAFAEAEITAIIDNPLSIPSYPLHTQGVERYIKLVTDASATVFGEEARDGYIRTVSYSRLLLPSLETKDDLRRLLSDD